MKAISVLTILAIFLGIIFIYLVGSVANPLIEEQIQQLVDANALQKVDELYAIIPTLINRGVIFEYISIQRFMLVLLIGTAAISCLFAAIHMSVDKLFFKEFYAPPDYKMAARRAIFLGTALVAIVLMRFLGVSPIETLLAPLLLIFVEIFISMMRKTTHLHNQEKEDEEDTGNTEE